MGLLQADVAEGKGAIKAPDMNRGLGKVVTSYKLQCSQGVPGRVISAMPT